MVVLAMVSVALSISPVSIITVSFVAVGVSVVPVVSYCCCVVTAVVVVVVAIMLSFIFLVYGCNDPLIMVALVA